MTSSNKFKTNKDLLALQQREFTKGGVLLKSVFSISTKHPVLSVVFAVAFGVMTNAIYDLISYPLVTDDFKFKVTLMQTSLVAVLVLICAGVIARIRKLHKDFFIDTPLDQKKLLITIVSKSRANFKDTPSYNTLRSLLYEDSGQAVVNNLEKVVLITTELPEVMTTANDLRAFIESDNREAEIYGVSINGKTLLEIQNQMAIMLTKQINMYAPHEIIVDYTGGTKDMSVALLRVSEKALVTPIYLNDATEGQYSKY